MSEVVADTHAVIWYLFKDKRLSAIAQHTLDMADTIYIPTIVLVEIVYLTERKRITTQTWDRLLNELSDGSLSAEKTHEEAFFPHCTTPLHRWWDISIRRCRMRTMKIV